MGIITNGFSVNSYHPGNFTADVIDPQPETFFKPVDIQYGEETTQGIMGRDRSQNRKTRLEIGFMRLAECFYFVPRISSADNRD